MRWDLTGVFWDDYVPPKIKLERIKRTPPDPVWLSADYLPYFEEASAFDFDARLLSDQELIAAVEAKERFSWDCEFYPNYSLIGFMSIVSKKYIAWEIPNENARLQEIPKLLWFLKNSTVIGFNSKEFDIPMLSAAIAGDRAAKLKGKVDALIHGEYGEGMRSNEFYRHYKLKPPVMDDIDLLELTPLGPSLKICTGRMHGRMMADLPFNPDISLSDDQKTVLKWYWVNDLENTAGLYEKHKTAIELREILTKEYGVDVRSKSDPQIAEAVIRKEISRITGRYGITRAKIEPGRQFQYRPPSYIEYKTPNMQWVLDFIKRQWFTIDNHGSPTESEALSKLVVPIGDAKYKMGIGGLHSQEKRMIHIAGDKFEISDNDVTSYYPSLIIQQGMYPPNVGPVFLTVFRRIYDRRIKAKKDGDKDTAETLKIVLNGTFGKTGERGGWSVVYYPEMMIQVTLSGQLALLMLIEEFELNGIQVISANTDGVTVKCPKDKLELKQRIMDEWQAKTELGLESKNFKAVYSRDVNNYIAIYEKPDEKEKGAYKHVKAIGAYRKTLDAYPMKWNPTCDVCSEAVIMYLAEGKSLDETIRSETDVRKFIEVRRVTGMGAAKDGEFLGKAIRWYYSTDSQGEILNAKNGYVIPRSQNGKPCMKLPSELPSDLNYDYYITRAMDILETFNPK